MADATTGPILFRNTIQSLRGWCDAQATDVVATLDALRASFSAVAGVEGRKVLFLLTERFTPSLGRDVWDYAQYGLTRFGSMASASPRQRRGGGSPELNDFSYKDFDRSTDFRALTTYANAAGVSLVTIDTEGITTDDMVSAESGASVGRMDEGMAQGDMKVAMGLLAEETGGKAITGRNDLALALKDTEADWTAYYSIGYESPPSKPGDPRAIKVT